MKICLVDHDIPFLCGRDNIEKLGVIIDFSQKTVIFKNIDAKVYKVRNSQAGHYVVDFERADNTVNCQSLSRDDDRRELNKSKEENKEDVSNITHLIDEVKEDDIVIVASDGMFDNLFENEIKECVVGGVSKGCPMKFWGNYKF